MVKCCLSRSVKALALHFEEHQPRASEGMIKARRDKTLWSEAEKRLGLREPGPEQERREASRILIMKMGLA